MSEDGGPQRRDAAVAERLTGHHPTLCWIQGRRGLSKKLYITSTGNLLSLQTTGEHIVGDLFKRETALVVKKSLPRKKAKLLIRQAV